MPNLTPPVTTVAAAEAYRDADPRGAARGQRLHAADDLLPDRRRRSGRDRARLSQRACSPRASSTPRMRRPIRRTASPTSATLAPALEAMQRIGMPLLVHGEVTDPDVDIFDREAVFIERMLTPLVARLSRRSRSCSSISPPPRRSTSSTRRRAEHRRDDHAAASASSTATRCSTAASARTLIACRWPSASGTGWRCARRRCRARPNSSSAPTARRMRSARKEIGLRLRRASSTRRSRSRAMPTVFDEEGALDRFEGFASEHGPRFYGLPLNEGHGDAGAGDRGAGGIGPGRRRSCRFSGETLGWRFEGSSAGSLEP